MSCIDDMDSVRKEIEELILHSKSKRSSITEPCTEENLTKYLSAVQEELSLLGIKYLFDPHTSELPHVSAGSRQELVRLTNGVWGLLLTHKDTLSSTRKLKDRNHALQQNNFYLNNLVEKLKKQNEASESKLKQGEEEKRRLVVLLDRSKADAASAADKLARREKQLAMRENQLLTEVKRRERSYASLQDKFRGQCGLYTSRNEAKTSYLEEMSAKEKKYKDTITKLQEANNKLVKELMELRDEMLAEESESEWSN